MQAAKLAQSFIEETSVAGHPTVYYHRQQFWLWNKDRPAYTPLLRDEAVLRVLRWLVQSGHSSCPKLASDVTSVVAAQQYLDNQLEMPFWISEPGRPNDHLTMKNGIINPRWLAENMHKADRHEVREHTPDWFSPVYIDYPFLPSATCPDWETWLSERIPDKSGRLMLQELCGYFLTRATSGQVALFLVGKASTGKSTVLHMIERVVGEDNCGHLLVSDFGGRFDLGAIQGRLVNISDETGPLSPKAEAVFKTYISGGKFNVDRKHLSRIEIIPTARLCVAVNSWPRIHDTTGAVYRRIKAIPMNEVIEHRDPSVEVRLHNFRSGVLNWALAGLQRFRRQADFTACQSGDSELQEVAGSFHNHLRFLNEYVTTGEGMLPTTDLEAAYTRWCRTVGEPRIATVKDFTDAIRDLWPTTEYTRRRVGGARRYGWCGLTLRRH